MNNTKDLALQIAKIIDEKRGEDIVILKVDHLTSIADYFIVAHGRNNIQVRAIAEEIEDQLTKEDIEPRRKEGAQDARWVVLDYASVIVHVFHPEDREYYHIERLWMDGSNQIPFEPSMPADQ